MRRITEHPILETEIKRIIPFYWNGKKLYARDNEMIASALIANDIHIFGHHPKDNSPQGIFCANGQCAQCTVIANGIPVKSCMTPVEKNMIVESCEGLPIIPKVNQDVSFKPIEEFQTEVLIIGGGPSGLSAALELAKREIPFIIVDDKSKLGGKLVLQTHKFFGSIEDCYAGTRGIEIAEILAEKLHSYSKRTIWTNSVVLYIFSDKKVGVLRNNKDYSLIKPKIILNAAGAREKMLVFPGNTLPGVYGAGAFQTLVNRDLVEPSRKVFILGGGNVGLIAGYHAIQAGIQVAGLAEAMPQCGGYKVHLDKLKRIGVPIYNSHSILSANGKDRVESITISKIDENFNSIPRTEKTINCDTILIAVGLNPINEFQKEAEKAEMKVFSTGDAHEIAEASSAMFNGKISGIKIAQELGKSEEKIPKIWNEKANMLKSPPGKIYNYKTPKKEKDVFPVFHCIEEIPCNPCISVCPLNSIKIKGNQLMGLPEFQGKCTGCMKCLLVCPGLAITLVDYRENREKPAVSIPYEIKNYTLEKNQIITVVDINGKKLANIKVLKVINTKKKTQVIQVRADKEIAKRIAGIRMQKPEFAKVHEKSLVPKIDDDVIVCRCERVSAGEIRKWIRKGITDMNQLKQLTRAGMGACGAKTCEKLILKMYLEEGYKLNEIILNTKRPLFMEVPLGIFSGKK